ncbi:hypothetical protein D3C85_1794110 [compost metagenome]
MHRRNRRLHGIGAERPAAQCQAHQLAPFGNLPAIPQATVLLVEQHEIAQGITARALARRLQQHQRQQADRLGVR